MPNKLTDAEVKKALEKQLEEVVRLQDGFLLDGRKTTELETSLTNALDLINRLGGMNEKNENIIRIADKTIATLNAENESLKAEVERLSNNISAAATTLSTSARATRHEAYKEFAERLKEKKRKMLDYDEAGFSSKITIVSIEEIDNLYKELVGDENGN